MENNGKSKRIFYLDALRTLAIISVIIFHVFLVTRRGIRGDFAAIPSLNWFICDITGVGFRIGVDLFLLLTGALLLGRNYDSIKSFLYKRVPRVTIPMLFWGFVISVVMFIIASFIPGFHNVNSITLVSFLTFLIKAYFAKAATFGPYWYFWMIMGIYLLLPIFNRWVLNCDIKEVEYVLVLWLITCLFTYTFLEDFPIDLSNIAGPMGMVIMGYYLKNTERKLLNNPYFAIVMIVASLAVAVACSYMLSSPTHMRFFKDYAIFTVFEVIGIFLLFKNFDKLNINLKIFKNENNIFHRAVSSIARYSYGIYLIHQFLLIAIISPALRVLPYKIQAVSIVVVVLFISWLIMAVCDRIPYLNNLIGTK